jgi:hypothetical protein
LYRGRRKGNKRKRVTLKPKPTAGLQTSRARRESTILGLVSESRVLVSARSRKLNRFSDSSRLGREAKTAARTRLGRAEPRMGYSRSRLAILGNYANGLGCYSNTHTSL